MKDFGLLGELNTRLLENNYISTILGNNIQVLTEGLGVGLDDLKESASKVLHRAEVSARRGADIESSIINKALVLLVLTDEDIRDALNMSNAKKINIIKQGAGVSAKIDDFLERLSKHPSIQSIINNMKQAIEDNSNLFADKLAKARLFFDRA